MTPTFDSIHTVAVLAAAFIFAVGGIIGFWIVKTDSKSDENRKN